MLLDFLDLYKNAYLKNKSDMVVYGDVDIVINKL